MQLSWASGHRGANRHSADCSACASNTVPGYAAQLAFDPVVSRRLRNAREQPGSVRVTGVLEDLPDWSLLDDFTGVHDCDTVCDARYHAQVVTDEQDARVDAVFQLDDKVQYGGLCGHVQTCRRLVHYQQVRIAGQRHGDDHTLLLPAAELVGIASADTVGIGQADAIEQLNAPGEGVVGVKVQVLREHLFDLRTDPHRRVERGHRVLIDYRDAIAPKLHELRGRQGCDIHTLESHCAIHLRRARKVAHHREGNG